IYEKYSLSPTLSELWILSNKYVFSFSCCEYSPCFLSKHAFFPSYFN
uniref:Uncharacterized protein n=1 Tax=Gopherus agassizii TaxID=38772 RepID=A0A452IB69_9SAUR